MNVDDILEKDVFNIPKILAFCTLSFCNCVWRIFTGLQREDSFLGGLVIGVKWGRGGRVFWWGEGGGGILVGVGGRVFWLG